jgi:tetratricopeptide (TPR) repeat protein
MGQRPRARRAFARAAALCRERLRTNPRDGHTLAQLAVYEAKLGSRADAARHADEAMALSPQAPDVIYRRAVVLALAGRAEESLVALERAIDRGYGRRLAQDDDDLSILRGRPEFVRITGNTVAALQKGDGK